MSSAYNTALFINSCQVLILTVTHNKPRLRMIGDSDMNFIPKTSLALLTLNKKNS